MAQSTMTLAELKIRAEDLLDIDTDSDLNDRTTIIAINDYLKSYVPEEQKVFPSNSRKEVTLTVPVAGYNLSLITDLGGVKQGFAVYLGTASGQRLLEMRQDSRRAGYYVQAGQLFIVGASTDTEVFITYRPTIAQFGITTMPDFNTTVLPVMVGAEKGAEYMIASRYTERDQAEPQKAENYMTKSLTEISTFFATHAGSAFISMR